MGNRPYVFDIDSLLKKSKATFDFKKGSDFHEIFDVLI